MQQFKILNLATRPKNKHVRQNFLTEEELQTILLKEYELNPHIKGYDYMTK